MARTYRTSLIITGNAEGGVRAIQATEKELRKLDRANDRSAAQQQRTANAAAASYAGLARSVNTATAAVAALGAGRAISATIRAYAEFDKGLISVGKTTNMAGSELSALGDQIQQMSQRVPVATSQLLEIAQSAGQLGVQGSDNILKFTETVAKIGLSTDLAGEQAATAFARMLTVTGEPIQNVDRLGAAIVALGNNYAATESEITNSSQRVAQATSQYDVGAANVVGIGTALQAVGVRAEEGGTQVGLAFQSINSALRNGGQQMETLQKITGETGDALREQFFNGKSAQVFKSFIDGLGRIQASGGDVTAVLGQMDLKGTRAVQVLGTLATRSKVLGDTLTTANSGWQQNVALNQEAAAASKSFTAQLQLVQNSADQAAAELGKVIAPTLIKDMGTFRDVMIGVADNMDTVVSVAGVASGALAGKLAGALAKTTKKKIEDRAASVANLKADRDAAAQTVRYAAAEDSAALSARNLAKAEYEAARGTNAEGLALQNLRARQVAAIETRGAYNAAMRASTVATAEYTAATNVAAIAARGLRTAIGFLGGPVGVAVLAATAIYEFRDELGLTSDPAKELKNRVDELTASLNKNSRASINNNLEKYRQKLIDAKDAAREAQKQLDQSNSPEAARYRNPLAFQMSGGHTIQGDQATRQLKDAQQEAKAAQQAIDEAQKAKTDLDARLRGDKSGATGATGSAGSSGDNATAALLNQYDADTVKLKKLRADRAKLVKAMSTAAPDNLPRYKTAIADIDGQIKKLTTDTKKHGNTASQSADHLAQSYEQVASSLQQQVTLFGQTSQAADIRYRIEQGDLSKLSASRKQNLLQMAQQLDQLNAQKDAVQSLFPEWQKLQQAQQLKSSVADLPQNMQQFGQRRASQLVNDAATQGMPSMRGLDPEYNGPFGEAERLGGEKDQYEQAYQRRLDSFRQYAATHKDEAATAHQAIEALEKQHQQRMLRYDDQIGKARSQGYESLYGDLTSIVGTFAGQQSSIYKSMFAAEKAYSLASTLVHSWSAITKAWDSAPFPANLPAVATTVAQTGVLQSAVSSVSMSGQAHDGIDNVPSSGTWNLEKGERVVDQRTNQDLKRYLNTQSTTNNNQRGGDVVFSPQVTVQAQPGMSDEDARRQGEQTGEGLQNTFRQFLMNEKRPGGMLSNTG